MSAESKNRVLNHLPSWWSKDKDSETEHIVKSFTDEFGSYIVEINNLHTEVYLNTATGQRLDDIGKIFKLGRKSGESDSAYRIRIKAYFPGFSGGGTVPAIKATVNRMTGLPEANVIVVEDVLKFNTTIVLEEIGQDELKPTITDIIWSVKAAGVYPFFTWELGGELLTENLNISDSIAIIPITDSTWFVWEASLIDGGKLLW